MTFLEFLSPLKRKKGLFVLLWLIMAGMMFFFAGFLPTIEKTTVFFTVKPVAVADKSFINDGVESAERVAEMIAGWAKDPNFLKSIQDEASIKIPKLKKKISARKQNRLNVFWILKLSGKEAIYSQKLSESLSVVLDKTISRLNEDSAVPLQITAPQIFSENLEIPKEWIFLISLFIAFFLAGFLVYGTESLYGKISFHEQVWNIFSETPIFQVPEKIGKHDKHQIELFLRTFESPRLISTFPTAGRYFKVVDPNSIAELDTPILLVKMGETTIRELENNLAIFGDDIGIVVFES
jgi:hypothetical protein